MSEVANTARLCAIEYYLPKKVVTNDALAEGNPNWTAKKIAEKTGILNRHIASDDECASDLAVVAAEKLFKNNLVEKKDIDFLLFCTQSPDYFLPTSACLIQNRLGLPKSTGALDFSLGCSGYVYGLGLAKGLIETGQAKKVLLLTGETYSKYLKSDDRSLRSIFGDGGTASVIEARSGNTIEPIGPFAYGTDGGGGENLIVREGCHRAWSSSKSSEKCSEKYISTTQPPQLEMSGAEIFTFTLNTIPKLIDDILVSAQIQLSEIDLFIFHQANKFMLSHLRKKLGIPEEKFFLHLKNCGNTVSCSIPIALHAAVNEKKLKKGSRVLLVGFGVGYSWAATMLSWDV